MRYIKIDVIIITDPLVLDLQLVHDGHLPGRPGQHDPDEDPPQGLRPLQQGR